jgi:hypothetical protein
VAAQAEVAMDLDQFCLDGLGCLYRVCYLW